MTTRPAPPRKIILALVVIYGVIAAVACRAQAPVDRAAFPAAAEAPTR